MKAYMEMTQQELLDRFRKDDFLAVLDIENIIVKKYKGVLPEDYGANELVLLMMCELYENSDISPDDLHKMYLLHRTFPDSKRLADLIYSTVFSIVLSEQKETLGQYTAFQTQQALKNAVAEKQVQDRFIQKVDTWLKSEAGIHRRSEIENGYEKSKENDEQIQQKINQFKIIHDAKKSATENLIKRAEGAARQARHMPRSHQKNPRKLANHYLQKFNETSLTQFTWLEELSKNDTSSNNPKTQKARAVFDITYQQLRCQFPQGTQQAEVACAVAKRLEIATLNFLSVESPDQAAHDAFVNEGKKAIQQGQKVLRDAVDSDKIWHNIKYAILGVGVFYLAAVSAHYMRTGHFLLFKPEVTKELITLQTTLDKCLDALEDKHRTPDSSS